MGQFSWAGAAAGVADARRQQQLDAQTAAEHELRRQALQVELTGREAAERRATTAEQRAARDQQLQEAGIALQQLESAGQGATVNPEIASLLRGTPYGARLEDKSTLPSRSIPFAGGANLSDPGGQGYSTLAPTQAQQEATARRSLLASLTSEQSGLSPSMRQFLRVREAGIAIPNPESLESQGDKDARAAKERETDFTDFERRERRAPRARRGLLPAGPRFTADAAGHVAPVEQADALTPVARVSRAEDSSVRSVPAAAIAHDVDTTKRDEARGVGASVLG